MLAFLVTATLGLREQGGGPPLQVLAEQLADRQTAADPGQLRAPAPGQRDPRRRAAARLPRAADPGHQPGTPRDRRGDAVPGAAAAGPGPGPAAEPGRAGPVRGGGAVPGPGAGGRARLRSDRGQPRRGGRAVPPAGRVAVGDRAGRRPDPGAGAAADPGPADRPVRAAVPGQSWPRRSGSRRCGPVWTGRSTCAPSRSGCCGRGCRCSPAGSNWTRSRGSAPTSTCPRRTCWIWWPAWWTSRSWSATTSGTARPRRRGTGCWRPSATTARTSSSRPARTRVLRRRHRDWYQQLAARARAEWVSDRQAYWLARLAREHPNLRAAMEFCLTEPGEAEAALRLAVSLPRFYWSRPGPVRRGPALAGPRARPGHRADRPARPGAAGQQLPGVRAGRRRRRRCGCWTRARSWPGAWTPPPNSPTPPTSGGWARCSPTICPSRWKPSTGPGRSCPRRRTWTWTCT